MNLQTKDPFLSFLFFSKIYEKVIGSRLTDYNENNKFLEILNLVLEEIIP